MDDIYGGTQAQADMVDAFVGSDDNAKAGKATPSDMDSKLMQARDLSNIKDPKDSGKPVSKSRSGSW